MFNEIKTEKDVRDFLKKTNQLHDGHIVSAIYTNNGIEKTENGGYSYSAQMTKLTLRVLVTSLWFATVEIEFEGLYEWQVKDSYIFTTALSFDDQGHIVWADEVWQTTEKLKERSYAVAAYMKWRIVE